MPFAELSIPGAFEWAGYEGDLDAEYAHSLFFGKSSEEVQQYFGSGSINRADELRFVPRRVFQYYVRAFADFILSERARGDSDSASPFLNLLADREQSEPGSVSEIYAQLEPAVNLISTGQEYFDAPEEIYGNFEQRAAEVEERCRALPDTGA